MYEQNAAERVYDQEAYGKRKTMERYTNPRFSLCHGLVVMVFGPVRYRLLSLRLQKYHISAKIHGPIIPHLNSGGKKIVSTTKSLSCMQKLKE